MTALMHIPTPLLLESFKLDHLSGIFEEMTGVRPTGIVYPVASGAGPNYASTIYRQGSGVPDGDLSKVAEFCRDRELELWLCFDTSMPFAASNANHVVDSQHDSARRCCINAPGTQKIVSLIAQEVSSLLKGLGLEGRVSGVVLPTQGLWPMGAVDNVIELTCLCSYCSSFYDSHNLTDLQEFSFFPNPLNLALKDSGTGLDHIHSLRADTTAEQLVAYSRAEQMLAADWLSDLKTSDPPQKSPLWDRLKKMAERLLTLIHLKQQLTIEALKKITGSVKDVFGSVRIAVIAEGLEYDWTAGYFFNVVLKQPFYDELWVPPSVGARVRDVATRLYCVQRGEYVVGEFSRHLELLRSPTRSSLNAGEQEAGLVAQTHRIANMLPGFLMSNPGDYKALDLPTNSRGVVVPLLQDKILAKILDSLPKPKTQEEQLQELLRGLANRDAP